MDSVITEKQIALKASIEANLNHASDDTDDKPLKYVGLLKEEMKDMEDEDDDDEKKKKTKRSKEAIKKENIEEIEKTAKALSKKLGKKGGGKKSNEQ